MRLEFGRTSVLASIGLVLIATAAVAGSGVGGVFNLGRVNTVNATTQLRGTIAGQQLSVFNTSTNANSTAVVGQSAGGTGVIGITNTRIGIRGLASATGGVNYGAYATTASPNGFAGYFRNTGSTTNPRIGRGIRVLGARGTDGLFPTVNYAGGGEFAGPNGVVGYSTFAGGAGVAGFTGTQGNIGVYGVSTKRGAYAGYFRNFNDSGGPTENNAILGLANGASENDVPLGQLSTGGTFIGPNGIIAVSTLGSGVAIYAVQGDGSLALSTAGHAWIGGDLGVLGTLTKGAGTFKIDHPLDPENKYLSHSFVESPDMKNVYDGIVSTDAEGKAIVELPDYFEALNSDPRYQLTVIGSPANAYVSQKVRDNRFIIRTSEPNIEVSWQVTGIRQDAYAKQNPIVVEEEKAVAVRGRYLHPEALGKPESLAIGASPLASVH